MITNSYLKLFNLLKDFYELTNIKISIANGNRNELFVYPVEYTDFCEYIRNIDSVRQKCAECDIRAFEKCKNTKETQIYKCHAGLTECIIPIIVNFEISGYIFIGQIRDSDELIYKPEYALCDKTLLDKYFQKLIKIDRKKILCAIHVLEACAGYEQLQYFIINNQHNFHMQLESFIDNNIGEKLSVYALCNHMHVSRCELYREIKNEYDCTPADLIKNKKKSDMQKRKEIIEKSGANLVVSIHMNSFPTKSSRGAQVFYDKNNEGGKALADCIQKRFVLDIENARKSPKHGDYFMVNCTTLPSVIVECGYLSNPTEDQLLSTSAHKEKVCYSIFCGVLHFLGLNNV